MAAWNDPTLHVKGCKQRDALLDTANKVPLLTACNCAEIRQKQAEAAKAARRPHLFSNSKSGVSSYGQKSNGAFVRQDIEVCPGATRAERKANLRKMEKERMRTFKFLTLQKEKNVESSAKPSE